MLSQEKLRVFKKVKPNDFKSVEVYEYIDYASIEYKDLEIAVIKEPTQIYTIAHHKCSILVACLVFAALLFLVLFVLVQTISKII